MANVTCPWTVFDDGEKDDVDLALDLTGVFTCVVTLWFILAYYCTSLKENPSYENIGALLLSAWLRRATPVIVNYIFINKKSEYWAEWDLLELFGFVETFMAVHEVECLTQICLERFVVSRYIYNEWTMPKSHYVVFRRMCLGLATLYSWAPSIGFGRYGFDFTCSSYTMDMLLPPTKLQELAALAIFSLRGMKPGLFMIGVLIAALMFQSKFGNSEYEMLQRKLTRDAILVTFINLACWAPIAMIRGIVLVKQPQYGTEKNFLPSPYYIKLALLLHWNSLLPTVIALFLFDQSIRDATLKLRFRDLLGKKDTSKNQ